MKEFKLDCGIHTLAGYAWEAAAPRACVVLLHGVGEYARRHNRLAVYLTRAGFSVYAMDLPGHGHSPGPVSYTHLMIVGRLVNMCIKMDENLETLTIKDFRAISDVFEDDIYDALSLHTCVGERKVPGGPAIESVKAQIRSIEDFVAALGQNG